MFCLQTEFAWLFFLTSQPTAGVSGGGAGWDSAREQEKLEARKMLENAQNPHHPLHALLARSLPCAYLA